MIGLRYHIVSLAAMFLALAGGIALGAGPLQDPVRGQLAAGQDAQPSAAAADLAAAERLAEFQAAYGAATSRAVLDGRLERTSVSLLLLPGAEASTVGDVEAALELADANLVSTLTFTAKLVDPANRQLAEGLARRVLAELDNAAAADGATGYGLAGAALGRSLLTRSTEALDQDGAATSIQAAFTEAGLLKAATVAGRAELALVVGGELPTDSPPGAADVVASLVGGLDRAAGGVVLVGPAGPGDADPVTAVHSQDTGVTVSTVAGTDSAIGRAVAVLALVEQATGQTGHYGPGAPDGALPDLGSQG